MSRMAKFLGMLLVLFSVLGTVSAEEVKYVFLFIGDGMSFPQRMLAEEFLNKTENRQMLINHFPYQAVTRTHAADSLITDSAASGTAIACGEKTNNGYLGVAPDGKRRLQSTAEVAKAAGRKVGIVSSVTINHATPAAFYGHQASRGSAYELGLDLIASDFDYFGGGGLDAPDNSQSAHYQGNIYDLAAKAGYTVTADPAAIRALTPGDGKVWARACEGAMPYQIDQQEGALTLADFTRKGIELLDNEEGFFMMVEGGKIDWMCHTNDAATVLRETIAFDDAVRVAYDFAQKHPEETLIVVTGDHETGGLTLGFAGTGYSSYLERLQHQSCSMDAFQEKLAAAKQADPALTFDGVKPLITESFGLQFTADAQDPMRVGDTELQTLKEAFDAHYSNWTPENPRTGNNLTIAVVRVFDNKAGLGWTSTAHTALPVNTTAYGAGAEKFTNLLDNTDVAKLLKETVK